MPAVSARSLCATGSPWSTPIGPRLTIASSARAASAIARSATSVTIALTRGLTCSIRARCAAMTSRAEISFLRSRAPRSTALEYQSSEPAFLLCAATPADSTDMDTAAAANVCPNSRRVTDIWSTLRGHRWRAPIVEPYRQRTNHKEQLHRQQHDDGDHHHT